MITKKAVKQYIVFMIAWMGPNVAIIFAGSYLVTWIIDKTIGWSNLNLCCGVGMALLMTFLLIWNYCFFNSLNLFKDEAKNSST